LHHLVVAGRINLSVVVPVTAFLFGLLTDHTWASFERIFVVVLVLTNCNFLLLNAFYHWVWQVSASHGARAYALLVLFVLPALGTVATAIGTWLLSVALPGVRPGFLDLLTVNLFVVVVYGVSSYSIADSRRGHGLTLQRLEGSQKKAGELERARARAEIAALTSLIKPHFVFNTLNAIATLIHEDQDRAEDITLRLARLLRYILDIQDGALITLDTEVRILQAYLEIEKVRLGDRLDYSIDVPTELQPLAMPAMLLQPLVENAVKHGVRERKDGGWVRIIARAEAASCFIEVADNGPGFSSQSGPGHGMRLVRDRLDRVYGTNYDLQIERDSARGATVVVLRFPLMSPAGAA
jgi:two-component system LytT family sensor kinase